MPSTVNENEVVPKTLVYNLQQIDLECFVFGFVFGSCIIQIVANKSVTFPNRLHTVGSCFIIII